MRILISFVLLLLVSCTSPTKLRDEFLFKYQHGNLTGAACDLTQNLNEEMPNKRFTQSKNAVWHLLNLSTIQFASGATKSAVQNYKLALEAEDYYGQPSSFDQSSQLMLEDACSAYSCSDFEKTLLRLYFALALLQEDDMSNATALLQQIETSHNKPNALCKYLFGAILEKTSDLSNASILYNQAEILSHNIITHKCSDTKNPTVIVLCHNGNAACKTSVTAPASTASAFALEMFLSNHRRPIALSAIPGIQIPALFKWPNSYPLKTIACMDGVWKPLNCFYNIDYAYSKDIQEKIPIIAARAVARYVLRRSAVYIADQQNSDLGALVDLGMLIANACTEADTRSWCTLPATIDVARFDPEPGKHTITIQIGLRSYTRTISLNTNDFCVINIFNLHPNITTIHIPHRFQL